jgi:hypothetical protein
LRVNGLNKGVDIEAVDIKKTPVGRCMVGKDVEELMLSAAIRPFD